MISKKSLSYPIGETSHCTPFEDDSIWSLKSEAINFPDPKATAVIVLIVPEDWLAQFVPSVEVINVPPSPTATRVFPSKAIDLREFVVPEFWELQLYPSGEV